MLRIIQSMPEVLILLDQRQNLPAEGSHDALITAVITGSILTLWFVSFGIGVAYKYWTVRLDDFGPVVTGMARMQTITKEGVGSTNGSVAGADGSKLTGMDKEGTTQLLGLVSRRASNETDSQRRDDYEEPNKTWVSYLNRATCVKTSNYCLFAVSCPLELSSVKKQILSCSLSVFSFIVNLLLMLSGDVESNPGPMSKAEADTFESALKAIETLQSGLKSALADFNGIKEQQAATSEEIKKLIARVTAIEASATEGTSSEATPPQNTLQDISSQLQQITHRCDDAENRLRRSNLLFFGLDDDEKEDWAASEEKIIKFCQEKLELPTSTTQYERVHRLGKFSSEKNRPIIAKLSSFKDKQSILSAAHKLKGTTFSIGEDFAPSTRAVRRKLVAFAKPLDKPFKLVLDKLYVDKKVYIYDSDKNSVVLSTK
ncbi:uncharacterized protein LOC144143023 [Haemaphysalis longicornis]